MTTIHTSSGYTVDYRITSNTSVYKQLAQLDLQPPKVPTYVDHNGVIQENPFSQKYAEAQVVHQKTIEIAMLDIMLESSVIFNEEWKYTDDWNNCRDMIMSQNILPRNNLELYFLKIMVFGDVYDQSKLAQEVFLTETRVYDIFGTVHIQREGVDIHKAYLKNTVDTGIEIQPVFVGMHQLVNPLDEFNSCVAGNMNWSLWYNGEYSLDEKASAVALSRLNRIREIHSDDAMQIESEKQSKRKNSGNSIM